VVLTPLMHKPHEWFRSVQLWQVGLNVVHVSVGGGPPPPPIPPLPPPLPALPPVPPVPVEVILQVPP
jgi:hypothetical protein